MVRLLNRWSVLALLVLASAAATPAEAAKRDPAEPDGLIVRIHSAGLVFIDIGTRSGVQPGDLFDIISSEVLSHPLTGDTLAVTPTSVGALKVEQVFDRMSVAKLLSLAPGEDPMLMPIMRVQSPERLEEIQKMMMRRMYHGEGGPTSLRMALIPGLYQIESGEKKKGWAILAASVASFAFGASFRADSNNWLDSYNDLEADLLQSQYDHFFDGASDRRTTSNRLYRLAAALYVYNWVDVLWLGQAAGLRSVHAQPFDVGLRSARDGQPLLTLTHRF